MKLLFLSVIPVLAMTACSAPSSSPAHRHSDFVELKANSSGLLHRTKDLGDLQAEAAMALEEKADIVVEYTSDGRMDIGIGRLETSGGITARHPQTFPARELIRFFEQQHHKKLIVVIFEKSVRSDAAIRAEVAMLNAYFKDRGYRRIVIQQYRAFTRETYSDLRV